MGSSSSKASRAAQAAEDKRRADIERTQQRIEGVFSSPEREADIQDYINSARQYNQQDIDREKQINDRQLNFALARSGQAGGSTSIDQNRNLSEAYLRAVVEGERRAQGAGTAIRGADQEAKLGLFNQALGGLDMTTSLNNSLRSMEQNIDFAKNVQTENNFDSFFSDFGSLFESSRKTAGERRQGEDFGTLYGPRGSNSRQVAGAV